MPIRFQCARCGAGFKAADHQAGHQLPCPKCGSHIEVPSAKAILAPPDDPLDETESAGGSETKVDAPTGLPNPFVKASSPPPPPPPPVALAPPPTANAFESPKVDAEQRDPETKRMVVTDVRIPIWSVMRLVFHVWLAAAAIGLAVWVIFTLLVIAFGAVAVALGL